jgi:Ankyrin repeats (3 copies)
MVFVLSPFAIPTTTILILLFFACSRLLLSIPASPPRDDSEEAQIEADQSWEPVRNWMLTHGAEEVRAAAVQLDNAGKTALHFSCQNCPPKDVIEVFLSVAEDTVQWADSFGWMPIHYACAYNAGFEVIKLLADAYPESKTTVDRKGRTPLHFALGSTYCNSPAVVVLLSSTGAATYADDNGMLVRSEDLFLFRLVALLCAPLSDQEIFFRVS